MTRPRAGLWLLALLAATCAPGRRDSLILISLDTVRADRLGSYGSRLGLTPRVDAFAGEAIRFADVTVQTPLTTPSHASLLTGLLPARHGIRNNESFALRAEAQTLAELLRAAGYRTGGFAAAFPLSATFGFGRGFDVYDDAFLAQGRQAERRADAVLGRALPFVLESAQADRPFFAFVHLFDAHTPYAAPEPFASQHAADPYGAEIAYLDEQLGAFLERLRAARVLDHALVAVLADHGEALGEHGENTHGALLYEATLRVPWLVRLPHARLGGRVVAQPVRALDVTPTLLGWLGIRTPAGLDGSDLSGAVERGSVPGDLPLYSESLYLHLLLGWGELRSLRQGSLKLIEAPRPELYDVASDPAELDDRIDREAGRAAPLRARLVTLRRSEPAPAGRGPDPEAAERLASLGYASGASRPQAAPRNPRDGMDVWREIESGTMLVSLDGAAARAHFERALALDPANGLALKSLGDIALSEGATVRAAQRYAQSRAAGFSHPDLDLAEARARGALGDAAGARALLARLPAGWEWQLEAAEVELETGAPADARRRAEAVLARAPNQAAALLLLGRALRAQGDSEGAEAALRRAKDSDSTGAALNELGSLLAEAGRRDEAASRFRDAIGRAPQAAEPRRNLALLVGDPEAERLLREALALRPAYPEARIDLAKLLARSGRSVEAAEQVRRALAQKPDDPEALFVSARVWELLGRPAEARAAYRRFLERAPRALLEPRRVAQQRLEALRR